MITSSNGNIFHVAGHLCGKFTSYRWFSRTKASGRALMFSLICTWINRSVNNREAGGLRCRHAHYDVIVMFRFSCLVSSSHQAINCTDVEQDVWCCMAAPDHNELTHSGLVHHMTSWSTMIQVMACCLMAPSHYLIQCWPVISEIPRNTYKVFCSNICKNCPFFQWPMS